MLIMIFLLPSLLLACPILSESEKQAHFIKMFNQRLGNDLTFKQLQNLTEVDLSTSPRWLLGTCETELFEYFGQESAKTKYLNVSSIHFKGRAYRTLNHALNVTSELNLAYLFALDKKRFGPSESHHYQLIDNNDYGWCNTIKSDWLKTKMRSTECQITEAVPICKIDMTNRRLEQLVANIKAECGSANLVHLTHFNVRVSGSSLNLSDDLPVNTVYFEGPGTLEFDDLAPEQAAIILSGNKKLYLKGVTLRHHNNNGIGIHVKAGELRLQGSLIEGFDYGVISEKGTRLYTWHERLGYQRGLDNKIEERKNETRIVANHTGVALYQVQKAVFVNTQIEPKAHAITNYNSAIQKTHTLGNEISLEQSDLARHSLWLQNDKTVRFIKLDHQGEPLPLSSTDWDCVYDRKTGVIWKADEFSARFTFEAAVKKAKQSQLCALNNWRLPTIEELYWLADRAHDRPAIETQYFPNTFFDKTDHYWSNTPVLGELNKAWTVNFRFGFDNHHLKSEMQRLRLVSGESKLSLKKGRERFQKVKDTPCFKETLTGQTWLKAPTRPYLLSQQAEISAFINQVNKQKVCHFSDWQLPQPENLYLLAKRTEESSYDNIIPPGNYWLAWPNREMFYLGSLLLPIGYHAEHFWPDKAYLSLVRGKAINLGEAQP